MYKLIVFIACLTTSFQCIANPILVGSGSRIFKKLLEGAASQVVVDAILSDTEENQKFQNVVKIGDKYMPLDGYKWLNSSQNDFRVIWSPGQRHAHYKNIQSSVNEGFWEADSGYRFKENSLSSVQWIPSIPHKSYSNIFSSNNEGYWEAEPGYTFKGSGLSVQRTPGAVQWTSGMPHKGHLNVVASSTEGSWKPASGYTWVNPKDYSYMVRPLSYNEALRAAMLMPLRGMVLMHRNP